MVERGLGRREGEEVSCGVGEECSHERHLRDIEPLASALSCVLMQRTLSATLPGTEACAAWNSQAAHAVEEEVGKVLGKEVEVASACLVTYRPFHACINGA